MFQSLTSLLADNPAQLYTGMAVSDIDGDGFDECIVAAFGGRNLVLKWGGDAFFDVAIPPLSDDHSPCMGVATADADGDGREEIYIGNGESATDRLLAWRHGQWTDLLLGLRQPGQSSQSILSYDRFGMGRYGFLVAHEGGPFRYYEIFSNDRVEDLAPVLGLARIAGGRSLVAGRILDDGLQIYAGNEGIANMLFVANDRGQFEERAALHGLADSIGMARGVALLDANFDGQMDVVCVNRVGQHRLFVQGSQHTFIDSTPESWSEPSNARSIVVADFDNDGFEEIFVQNHGEPNRLFAWRDNDWRRIDCGAALEPDGFGVGAVVADFNGDGMLELLLGHGETFPQPLSLFGSVKNDNHWLRVCPRTGAGAPARGAIVTLLCWGGREQIRLIDCGSGYLCQSEAVAHFGLGLETTVKQVTVKWMDGTILTIENPAVNQVHRIAYPNQER